MLRVDTAPPSLWFEDGPAAGWRPVLPSIEGLLPLFTTVPEPVNAPYATLIHWPHDTPRPPEHVYQRMETIARDAPVYKFVRSIVGHDIRITCPCCGLTSAHPRDAEHGYCAGCHDQTRIPRYGVMRAAPGSLLPPLFEGSWYDLDNQGLPLRSRVTAGSWQAGPLNEFERNDRGGYAVVMQFSQCQPLASGANENRAAYTE